MSIATKKAARRTVGKDTYLALVQNSPLRVIRNDAEYAAAAGVLDALAVRDEKSLDKGEADYLAVLSMLIEAYDQEHHPEPEKESTVADRLKSLMESSEMSAARLAEISGLSRSAVSMALTGQRELSKAAIRRLAAYFGMDAGYFL